MADWKDFFEDGKEFRGQFLDAIEQRQSRTRASAPPPPLIRFCPLCDKPFTEETVLLEHVRHVHGPQHVYLRLNGSVIRDVGWAVNGISELIVVPIGFPKISVQLRAEQFSRSIQATDDTDLLTCIPADFEGQLAIDVSGGLSGKRTFVVYTRSLPEFRQDILDSSITTLSTESLARNEMPDVNSWRHRIESHGELESRYLNGFFEYALAFHLDEYGNRTMAKHHFDESLGLLLPFRTPMAKSAQCVLGLRMNCFGVLRHAARNSVLALCDIFFNCSAAGRPAHETKNDPNPFITYADEFILLLVQSIANFCRAEYAECLNSLRALEFHPSAREKNNEDKLLLLSARLHKAIGNRTVASEAYDRLQFHPDFGNEAKEFINGAD